MFYVSKSAGVHKYAFRFDCLMCYKTMSALVLEQSCRLRNVARARLLVEYESLNLGTRV